MSKNKIYFLMFLVVALPSSLSAAQVTLYKAMGYGATGIDVKNLQIILNSNPDTRIAESGLGSAGNETMFFGNATKNAVIRFQNKYPNDILIPAGLSSGNGFVGSLTLKKLNAISALGTNTVTVAQTIPTDPLDNYKVSPNESIDIYANDKKINSISADVIAKINAAIALRTAPKIDFSSYSVTDIAHVMIRYENIQQGPAGTKVTLEGIGFNSDNSVYFGNNYILRKIPQSYNTLSFVVPNIPPGRYDVAVKNSAGLSNTVVFVTTTSTTTRPIITSITPSTVQAGGQLTVHGSGFTPTGNDIVTSLQKFTNVSSADGKTLTATLLPEGMKEIIKMGKSNKTMNLSLSVINNNGITATPSSFTFAY